MSLAWLDINLTNLKSNIKNLKYLVKPQTQFMAVVKSNAYGHGIIKCAQAALDSGVGWLGVVNISEGLLLRKNGIKIPILVLGYPELSEIQAAAQHDISIPIVSLDYAKRLADIKLVYRLKVHLKIETGINRLGMDKKEILAAYKILYKNKKIYTEGIYSHFASVEEKNLKYSQKQIDRLLEVINSFKKRMIVFDYIHIAASAAIMLMPQSHFNMVRSGISIYGLWPSDKTKRAFLKDKENKESDYGFLKSVLTYKTKLIQAKKIKKGEVVGYGCSYRAKRNTIVGIIPVGYSEGIDRKLSNIGEVLFDGRRCKIVGRVCMNMTIIDISKVKNYQYKIDDEVVIIGKQGNEEITVDDIAKKIDSINYEVVTRIPEHIQRIYK